MGILAPKRETGGSDPILTRLANEDTVPWYRKPNLRMLYFLLLPTCIGVEMTSGFDSQMINALQGVPTWKYISPVAFSSNVCDYSVLVLVVPFTSVDLTCALQLFFNQFLVIK